MSFPKLEVPVLSCTLPLTGKKIEYRPYTVKEDKLLNLVMTEKNDRQLAEDMMTAVLALSKACTFNAENIGKYAVADLEYLFLKIRTASSGSVVSKIYQCQLLNEDGELCGEENRVDIDLDDTELSGQVPEKLITLTDSMSLSMKIPTFESIQTAIANAASDSDASIATMAGSVDMVILNDEVFTDFTQEQLVDNIFKNMTQQQILKLKNYFESVPSLIYKKEFECKGCGSTHELEVKHLVNFFD